MQEISLLIPQCRICGSKRRRNLRYHQSLDLRAGKVDDYWLCLRCEDVFELLGDGKDRVHPVGSNPTGKRSYRYLDIKQVRRVKKRDRGLS